VDPYCVAEWRVRRVGVDYHVELEGHFYGVPYRFARSEVEVRLTPRAVRRQSFWDNGLGKLREALAHQFGDFRRPATGAASGGWRWSVV
jgi:hypothetical protein